MNLNFNFNFLNEKKKPRSENLRAFFDSLKRVQQVQQLSNLKFNIQSSVMTIPRPFHVAFPKHFSITKAHYLWLEVLAQLAKTESENANFLRHCEGEKWYFCLCLSFCKSLWEKNTRACCFNKKETKTFSWPVNDVFVLLLLFWLPSLDTSLVLLLFVCDFYRSDYFPS